MQRPWFSRRWVVQEIALAKEAMIYCGKDKIDWRDFSVAVELFVEVETATHRLSEVMKKDPKFYHVPGWFEYVSALGASLLVDATRMISRRYKPRRVSPSSGSLPQEPSMSAGRDQPQSAQYQLAQASQWKPRELLTLEYLVCSLSVFEASKAHDAIYALLAIARDTIPAAVENARENFGLDKVPNPADADRFLASWSEQAEHKKFPVDYDNPFADVCKDFMQFCINQADPTRALDIICRPWAPIPRPPEPEPSDKQDDINERRARKRAKKEHQAKRSRTDTTEPEGRNVGATAHLQGAPAAQQQDRTGEPEEKWPLYEKYYDFLAHFQDDEFLAKRAEDRNNKTNALPLPSWIPRLTAAPFALQNKAGLQIQKMSRVNADPLVGLPIESQRNYSAAGTMKVDRKVLRFRKRLFHPRKNHYSMFVSGFQLDTVDQVTESSQAGAIPKEWTDLAGWTNAGTTAHRGQAGTAKQGGGHAHFEVPEEFWRTIIADRGRDGQNPPYYYAKACEESVSKGGILSGAVNTTDLINNERNSVVAQFCRRVQAVVFNRCMIKTKGGHLGLARKGVRKDDLVCILYGCSVPVILRQNKKGDGERLAEEEEDGVVATEKLIRQLSRNLTARKMRKERYRKAFDKQLDQAPEHKTGDVKDVKFWGRKEIKDYTSLWNAKQETIEMERKKQEEASKRVKNLEEEQKKINNLKRNVEQLHDDKNCWFEFKGESYIYGMMDGEAMHLDAEDDPKSRLYKERVFELR